MDNGFWTRLFCSLVVAAILFSPVNRQPVSAESPAPWWDDHWPYRVPITLSTTGVVGVNLNFSQLFTQLGLEEALVDLKSVRVIPYKNGVAGDPLPYQETYSTPLYSADSLNTDPGASDPYWITDENVLLNLDEARFTQGTGSIHSDVHIYESSPFESGLSLNFNDLPPKDWSTFEVLLYDVWPGVNTSAMDQAPDLYFFELEGLDHCLLGKVNSPPLILDQWNAASVSLKPFGSCSTPDLSAIDGMNFYLRSSTYSPEMGYYEPGDRLQLWLDNFRLVDQDGTGQIRWNASDSVDGYYIYFDTLNHEGHHPSETIHLGEPLSIASSGLPETGGYFHQVSSASTEGLAIWNAPPSEKILKTYQPPISTKPLIIHAARGEFEPIQIVVRSSAEQSLKVSTSNLIHTNGLASLPASQVHIFRVDFVPISQISDFYGRLTDLPDPLYPISNGQRVVFPADENQPLWFRVEIPANAPAGIYTGTLTIGPASVPFSVEVWPFSLPKDTGLESRLGINWDLLFETYSGTVGGSPQPCYEKVASSIHETLADYRIIPIDSDNTNLPVDVQCYTLSNYEITKAQTLQIQNNQRVWWHYQAQDHPPFSNPAVIDRPGVNARILPWLTWMDRVDSLYYPNSTDWDINPWETPFLNSGSNGDGFLFYPPKDDTIAFDPCITASNRLVPSIRLEMLREGLEDYAYLQLLSGSSPAVGVQNPGDPFVRALAGSETTFNRIPTAIGEARLALARLIIENIQEIYLPLVIR